MATVYQSTYLSIQHHRASAYIRVLRSKDAFSSVTDAIDVMTAARNVVAGIDTSRYGILYDWRRAPMSTDPSLHKALVEHMDALAEPFARRAILVATSVGAMQVNRMARTKSDGLLTIFSDEDAAVLYVSG